MYFGYMINSVRQMNQNTDVTFEAVLRLRKRAIRLSPCYISSETLWLNGGALERHSLKILKSAI